MKSWKVVKIKTKTYNQLRTNRDLLKQGEKFKTNEQPCAQKNKTQKFKERKKSLGTNKTKWEKHE